MPSEPMNIQEQGFRSSLFGFDKNDVLAYMNALANEAQQHELEYQRQLQELQSKLDELRSERGSYDSRMDALRAELAAATQRADAAETKQRESDEQLETIKKKTASFQSTQRESQKNANIWQLKCHDLQQQVDELAAHVSPIDYDAVAKREKEVRHDVMAHVYTYGKAAPSAAGIIHLGATSCYITDNADIVLYRDGLKYLRGELLKVIANLSRFAETYKATPTLGYTHYQPAQLVTVGKRATLWMQDFVSDLVELDFVVETMKFLGCRGTTGTEASFLELFDGDTAKIDEMNRRISADFGFTQCFDVCGQTYPRKLDSRILNCLSSIAQSCYRMANDIRLLQHDRQVEEPFEKNQIGSSAMAYKRNPMRSERICSLSRYLMADALNAPMTASTQWLERPLDDSANRRISMPEGFLCADAILRLAQNVTDGLHVNEKIVEKTVREYLPFIATENLMMEGVKNGGDRQEIHERVRVHSQAAATRMKRDGLESDLLDRIAEDPAFPLSREALTALLAPEKYTGRAEEQTVRFIETVVDPILAEQKETQIGDIRV